MRTIYLHTANKSRLWVKSFRQVASGEKTLVSQRRYKMTRFHQNNCWKGDQRLQQLPVLLGRLDTKLEQVPAPLVRSPFTCCKQHCSSLVVSLWNNIDFLRSKPCSLVHLFACCPARDSIDFTIGVLVT